jgi:hypothetical protein
MASLEQIALALDAVRNLQNLRRDIKANAAEYEKRILAGQAEEEVLLLAKKDAEEYERRVSWHSEGDVSLDLEAGIAALGIEDYAAELSELSAKASGQRQAPSLETIKAGALELAERKTLFKAK